MTITASLFISVVIVSFLLWLSRLINQKKLSIKYALSWIILAFVLFFITWFPSVLVVFSAILGVKSEINLVFFAGFCLSLWIIFWLTNTVSLQANKLKKLTQEIALLKKELTKYD